MTASTTSESPLSVLDYFDVVLVLVAALILLLAGAPALGCGLGAGAWIVLRAAGVAVDRAIAGADPRVQVSLRLTYIFARLIGFAVAVVIARRSGGPGAALAALGLIVFAFTIQLGISVVNRPRPQ